MNRFVKLFERTLKLAEQRNWEKYYVFVDIHDTILKSNYTRDDISREFYPLAKEALQTMSSKQEICLIMYTCSFEKEIQLYKEFFKEHGITFDYINENPEVIENAYGNYRSKPYSNLLLDDKAAFQPEKDWKPILTYLTTNYKFYK